MLSSATGKCEGLVLSAVLIPRLPDINQEFSKLRLPKRSTAVTSRYCKHSQGSGDGNLYISK